MRLLITGATGFVGVNFVRSLAASPQTTVIATDLRPPDDGVQRYWAPVRDRIEVVELDVTRGEELLKLVDQAGVTHILHCAAITPSPEDERTRPDLVSTVNLVGTLNVLEATRRVASVQRLLLMSSSGVYAAPGTQNPQPDPNVPISEDAPLALDNLYAITKRSAELLGARYRVLSGKAVASIRLGAFYGRLERRSPSRPHLSVPGRLLAALQAQRLGTQLPLTVSGGAITRDWIYADDAAAAVHGLLAAPEWRYDLYNLGGGRATSLCELVSAFVDQGLQVTWVNDSAQADICMVRTNGRQTMSIQRISLDADWQPVSRPRTHVAELCA
jgi:UDP-glucose 4-epimerase